MGTHSLVNLDPPYFGKGPELYANFYLLDEHVRLTQAVRSICKRWMVIYDDKPEIRRLYAQYPLYNSSLNYSAQIKRVGTELLVLDPRLHVPKSLDGMEISTRELEAV